MSTIAAIVRLRWTLTISVLRRSVLQTIGYCLLLAMGVGAVVGAARLAAVLGAPGAADHAGFTPALNMCVVTFGAAGMLVAILIQLMLIGEGSALTPQRFELYGIPDSRLQWGLIAAGLTGPAVILGTTALAAWAFAYRQLGAAVVAAGVIAGLLVVVTVVFCSKAVVSLATTLVTTARGKAMFYIVIIVVFVVAAQLPGMLAAQDPTAAGSRAAGDFPATAFRSADPTAALVEAAASLAVPARIAALTPFGAAFQLPFDVAAGAWTALAVRLVILAAAWTVCFLASTWCLKRQRLTRGADTSSKVQGGLGAFAHMPEGASGAVSARLVTYLKRDPRQALLFVMPLIMVIAFAIQAHGQGITLIAWQSLVWMGLLMMMTEGNGIAYDGTGFAMEVIAGVRGVDDRIGRVRVYAVFAVVYQIALAALLFAATGDWRSAWGVAGGLTCAVVGLGVTFAALGLAQVLSTVLLYPVPSIDRPFSSPQGRAAAQGLFPFAHMFGTVLVMLPTGIAALVALLAPHAAHPFAALAAVAAVALANGAGALALGTWLGGKLLDARAVRILGTLGEFASLQK